MPFSQQDAPAGTPTLETIESLLGKRNDSRINKSYRDVKTLQELSDDDKSKTHLVELGVRTGYIEGDPFGVWCSWAGNVHHAADDRISDVLPPLFEELRGAHVRDDEEITSIRSLLEAIATMPLADVPAALSVKEHKLVRDTPEEIVLTFKLGSRSVRLMQCRDLDVSDETSYNRSTRARSSQRETDAQLSEGSMTADLTHFIMAQLFTKCKVSGNYDGFTYLKELQDWKRTPSRRKHSNPYLMLRLAAQEHFWLHMSPEDREEARKQVTNGPESLLASYPAIKPQLELVKGNWKKLWESDKRYPDFFRAYLRDQTAASNVWEYIKEDIFVATDRNRQVVFANVENLAQHLFGKHIVNALVRCIDMWSHYTPLPLPESSRHVVDSYIRKIHPELDPSKATVETLQNAKMAVAHYGCWAAQGDPHGRLIYKTRDWSHFPRGYQSAQGLMDDFSRATLGKAAEIIRFLVKPLDPGYYQDCMDILSNIKDDVKPPVDGSDPFISMFALGINGYTQRHKDRNDVHGGLAGLCTFGSYTGGNLCIPQLKLKVTYQPGACALIRGTALDHLVADYSGPRFFIIGTNHESVKRHAWRNLGRLPPLTQKRKREEVEGPEVQSNRTLQAPAVSDDEREPEDTSQLARDDDSEYDYEGVMESTCVASGTDDDDDIKYTNRELHGAAALDIDTSDSAWEDDSE